MKTITIPKSFGYPTLDITVNGKVYTVKSGEEIAIEDHLAEAIENAVALVPKTERYKSRFAQFVEGSITEVKSEELDGITNISRCSFYNYYNLVSIEIPESVTSIGNYAFDDCNDLVGVYLPNTPPALAAENAFASINAGCVFYCKTQSSLDAYKAAPIWSALAGKYTFVVED